MNPTYAFDLPIKSTGGGGFYVEIPLDIHATFGTKGQVKIQATFDGEPYRGILSNMGMGCHVLIILKEIRKKIGKGEGDTVNVCFWQDTEPRILTVPDDMTQLLQTHDLQSFYDSLSFTNRKEWVVWITGAKQAATREKRLLAMVEKMKNGLKNPTMK